MNIQRAADVEVTVVMPVLNGATTITDQLEALAEQTYSKPWELIVADNGSTDQTLRIVAEWGPKLPSVTVIDASDRRGRDHACNEAVRQALGAVVLFCDADDVVDRSWIELMTDAADLFDLWGGAVDTESLNRTNRTALGTDSRPSASLPDGGLGFLPYVPGGNMGVVRHRFLELGGFDESYVGNCEDKEFSWRAQLAGMRAGFATEAILFSRARASAWATWKQRYGYSVSLPELYRRFRVHGMPRSPLSAAARDWAWAAMRLPTLPFTPRWRRAWGRTTGSRSGRLVGSIRHRVLYL
jgi:glycosyltransferase involved in cell wall biosynthesis